MPVSLRTRRIATDTPSSLLLGLADRSSIAGGGIWKQVLEPAKNKFVLWVLEEDKKDSSSRLKED
jgi:hypothetical protein